MALPLVATLTLPEIWSAISAGSTSLPAVEITGTSLAGPLGAGAVLLGLEGYKRYLDLQRRWSAERQRRSAYGFGPTVPVGAVGSRLNPVKLPEVTVTPKYGTLGSRFYASNDSTGTTPANPTAAPADTTRTALPAQGSNSAPANPDPNKNKGFKDKLKQVLKNIKRGYGNALTGLEYGIGFGAPIAGLGYGIYRWTRPDKTRADSILDSLLYLVGELSKVMQVNENLKKIDALLKQIQSGSIETQPRDSNYLAPQPIVTPTDTLDF